MSTLFGREREMRALTDLFDAVNHRGGALVVRGEAGVGKTALLAEAGRYAEGRGCRVLRTTGVQTEAALPFASLHWEPLDRLSVGSDDRSNAFASRDCINFTARW